jgi:hypothetical protein
VIRVSDWEDTAAGEEADPSPVKNFQALDFESETWGLK